MITKINIPKITPVAHTAASNTVTSKGVSCSIFGIMVSSGVIVNTVLVDPSMKYEVIRPCVEDNEDTSDDVTVVSTRL